jgi:plastocyanin
VSRFRLVLVSMLVIGAAVSAVGGAQAAKYPKSHRLFAQDGPGFTITIKNFALKPVKKVKPGKYLIKVDDRSTIHNFHLKGPGVNKTTTVKYFGSKFWQVTLKRGTYTFVCDPHKAVMHGKLKVG